MSEAARQFLVAVSLAFAVAGASSAGPYEDAVAAYERGDYATAVRLWRPLAERGDPGAQLMLGSMLHDALGVPRTLQRRSVGSAGRPIKVMQDSIARRAHVSIR